MATAAQIDDNMVTGQTYTFQMSLDNYFTLPKPATLQQDLNSNAPSFVSNDLQVTLEQSVNPFKNVFDVQFTYNGDGSDVIGDVASLLVSAIKSGSNDNFSFVAAYSDFASNVGSTSVADITKESLNSIGGTIGDALQKTTESVTNTAAKGAQYILTPIEIAVAIVVGLVVLIIFTSGKAGGFSASETGVKIGGR